MRMVYIGPTDHFKNIKNGTVCDYEFKVVYDTFLKLNRSQHQYNFNGYILINPPDYYFATVDEWVEITEF
jgi:hypothetical protein